MSKRYSGKSFKDSSVMKKPKLTFKEKRKLKEEKKEKMKKLLGIVVLGVFNDSDKLNTLRVSELLWCYSFSGVILQSI